MLTKAFIRMDILKCILFVIIALSQICWSSQEDPNTIDERKRILDQLLQNYDTRVRPTGVNGTDGPAVVKVNFLLRTVTSISDYDMDYGIQVTLRQEWVDDRLKYEDKGNIKYLLFSDMAKVWTPDLFISNEKDSHLHKLMTPNTFVRIYPSGLVLYSARLSLTLWCHMQLERFPFDTQLCNIKMAAYGSTTSDVVFIWKDGDPVQVVRNINIMGFTLGTALTSYCTVKTNTGEYSCLRVDLPFKRDLKYYMLHTFLPSIVLVVVSWASFWMDRRAVVARILLVLSTLFAMSSLATDIEASVPHVPYIKAMDIWAGACFTFLLAALVEFAVVNATSPSEEENLGNANKSLESSIIVDMKPLVRKSTDSTQTQDKENPKTTSIPFYQGLLTQLPRDPSRIDSHARLLFPTIFLVFTILYFFIYFVFDNADSLE